jgi:hypothetical protein
VTTDLLGSEPTPQEQALLDVYATLKVLAADGTVAPCVTANVKHALAAVAQAVNDLGLDYEHLLQLGV